MGNFQWDDVTYFDRKVWKCWHVAAILLSSLQEFRSPKKWSKKLSKKLKSKKKDHNIFWIYFLEFLEENIFIFFLFLNHLSFKKSRFFNFFLEKIMSKSLKKSKKIRKKIFKKCLKKCKIRLIFEWSVFNRHIFEWGAKIGKIQF